MASSRSPNRITDMAVWVLIAGLVGAKLVLFALAPDERLSEHTSARAAIVHVLRGEGELVVAGDAVVYVSDAGTPAVSDPGARLVAAVLPAVEEGGHLGEDVVEREVERERDRVAAPGPARDDHDTTGRVRRRSRRQTTP